MKNHKNPEVPDEKWFRENAYRIPSHEHDFDDVKEEESKFDEPQVLNKTQEQKSSKVNRVAEELVHLTLDKGAELYLDQLGEPHITFQEKPMVGFPIKSSTLRRWLAGQYWELCEKGFSGETFATVVGTLEGKCFHEGQAVELFNRIARVDEIIYYDLGDDSRVVRVDKNGWEVIGYPDCSVRFRRFSHQLEQVEPMEGGTLTDVFQFINLKTDTDRLLFLTYLVAACIPDIPRVALINTGDQGSAKSTSLRIARSLIDPSKIELLDPISDLKELAQAANHHYCLYLDNLSYLRDELSDTLSRLVTGIGFTKRQLFTDQDDIVFKQLNAVGLSGISLVATKPDLLERSLIQTYDLIPKEKRQGEEELWSKFNELKPAILGGLFDTLSQVLRIAPQLKFSNRPRMADYTRYAAAAAIALGSTQEAFLIAFDKNTAKQNETALEASVTANAIIQFMSDKEKWEGLSSELYAELRKIIEDTKQQIGGEGGFPRAVNHLWKRIIQVRPNLISIGINPIRSESSAGSLITLTKTVHEEKPVATTAITASVTDIDMATVAVKNPPLDIQENKKTVEQLTTQEVQETFSEEEKNA